MAENDEQDEGAVEYGGNSVSFEEMEAARNQPAATDFSKITLDGDDIPEGLRGKSVSELLQQVSGLQKAVQISESARLALQNSQEALTASRQASAPVAPQAPVSEPELNEEQLEALFQESPRKYHDYMADKQEKRILGRIQGVIAPVLGSSADLLVRDAQNRYPDEFASIGSEIQSFISALPDKSTLNNPGAMDDLVAYMRGKHWTKFQAHLTNKNGGGLEEARESLRRETPSELPRTSSPTIARTNGGKGRIQLDETAREVARAMGLSDEQYIEGMVPSRGRRG